MKPFLRGGSFLLGGVAALVVAADQLSKAWVVQNLPEHVPVDVFPWLHSVLSFTRLTNTGVAFGLFPQFGDFFTVLAAVVIVAILFFYRTLEIEDWLMHLALGLQIGGALGNLVDRIFRGSVVDFLDVNFWPLHEWPVFNLADSAIVVGVALLLLSTWRQERKEAVSA
jgi:signal peptidase II